MTVDDSSSASHRTSKEIVITILRDRTTVKTDANPAQGKGLEADGSDGLSVTKTAEVGARIDKGLPLSSTPSQNQDILPKTGDEAIFSPLTMLGSFLATSLLLLGKKGRSEED